MLKIWHELRRGEDYFGPPLIRSPWLGGRGGLAVGQDGSNEFLNQRMADYYGASPSSGRRRCVGGLGNSLRNPDDLPKNYGTTEWWTGLMGIPAIRGEWKAGLRPREALYRWFLLRRRPIAS